MITKKRVILGLMIALIIMVTSLWCCKDGFSVFSKKSEELKDARPKSVISFRDNFFGISCVGTDNVWIVGDWGTILHTSDRGKTWERQDSNTKRPLYGVDFLDLEKGYVVGYGGIMLRTENGGKKWEQVELDTENSLFKVKFITKDKGWVVGERGTIFCTRDGGNEWEEISLEEDVGLNDIVFIDENNGWIVGEFGTVLRTTDGGENWVKQETGTEITFFGIAFSDQNNGWAVGLDGVIMETKDGGATWTELKRITKNPLIGIAYSTKLKRGIAVGLRGTMITTEGTQCEVKPEDVTQCVWRLDPSLRTFLGLNGVAFSEGLDTWIIGDHGTIFHNTEQEKAWRPVS